MFKQSEVEKMIKSGFDLELISFESDIPMQELKQLEEKLKEQHTSNSSRTQKRNGYNTKKHSNSKINQLRKRYNSIYYRENKPQFEEVKDLSPKEVELINSTIIEVKGIMDEIEGASKKEKAKGAKDILSKVKKIQDYQLTINQSEELSSLLMSEELQGLKSSQGDKIDFELNKTRSMMVRKLAQAIDIAQLQTEDVEVLKSLKRKMTLDMEKYNKISVGGLKSKINNRISIIQQKYAMKRIRSDVPRSILEIIRNLANGTIDIQKAKEVIEEEVKNRESNKTKTRFTLTEDQERRQILRQIQRGVAGELGEIYINNPEITVLQMQELCGGRAEEHVEAVVENLLHRKDFDAANKICNKFSSINENVQDIRRIRNLKMKIKHLEIGEMVIKGLNMNGTVEEENEYFDLIEKGIKMGNVKLEFISLGKNQEGSKTITLADIWEKKKTQEKVI